MRKFFHALRVLSATSPLAKLLGVVVASALMVTAWALWNVRLAPAVGRLRIVVDRDVFLADESPEFFVRVENESARSPGLFPSASAYAERIGVDVVDAYGNRTPIQPTLVWNRDGLSVSIPNVAMPRPGRYALVARIEKDGSTYAVQKDFTWGVLAVNLDKSMYLSGETAQLSLAVLNDYGQMVCDADVTLAITDPDGKTTELNTSGRTITVSPACTVYGKTSEPDYSARYVPRTAGIYAVTLTAKTANGVRTVHDVFAVEPAVDFSVQRRGPTRIYPELPYEMALTITARTSFTGAMVEYVPASFAVAPQRGLSVVVRNDRKELRWQVRWVRGRTYRYRYTFDAPNVSPALYHLGKLRIGDFEERRFWQIAADAKTLSSVSMTAPTTAQSITVGSTFTITCDPTCTGSGGNPDVTDNYQYTTVNGCGSGNTNIDTSPATADVLSVGTNPETATNCGSTSDTMTGRNPGTVYISCYSTEGPRTARSSECISVTVTTLTVTASSTVLAFTGVNYSFNAQTSTAANVGGTMVEGAGNWTLNLNCNVAPSNCAWRGATQKNRYRVNGGGVAPVAVPSTTGVMCVDAGLTCTSTSGDTCSTVTLSGAGCFGTGTTVTLSTGSSADGTFWFAEQDWAQGVPALTSAGVYTTTISFDLQ